MLGPRGVRFLVSEVSLYAFPKGLRSREWYLTLPRDFPLPKTDGRLPKRMHLQGYLTHKRTNVYPPRTPLGPLA